MRITGRIAEIAQNHCFVLEICPDTLQEISTKPVFLTDGCDHFPLIQGESGNRVRWDQLVILADYYRKRHCGKKVRLLAYMGNDGAGCGDIIHFVINSRLPRTTHISNQPPVI